MYNKFLFILFFISTLNATEHAAFIGEQSCKQCHKIQVNDWQGSHHDLAMMVANKQSVKGDFNDVTFDYNGIISRFYKKDTKFMVNTQGVDGNYHDYEIAYTFGIYPLQQYLIKFPQGRMQVLEPSWDNRSKEEGGQRWYHTHKKDNVKVGDPLHWTGPNMNWNYMCADCHSTNFKKNYNSKTSSYKSTWNSINVSCEACHGPASKHLEWSKNKVVGKKGFSHVFNSSKKPVDLNLKRDAELNVCAKCHSRRSQLDDDFIAGDSFSNHYLPVNLDDSLYFADGKIDDEVYVYNSFLQSKMFEQGVTCSDCHNPHSLELKKPANQVCAQCHEQEKYFTKSHHFHEEKSTGSRCTSCHMPARTYMGIDNRNDHSFRIPRPDISIKQTAIPNACNLCHQSKSPQWAADILKKWYKKTPIGKQDYAHQLTSLRENALDAPKSLYEILLSDAPTIAKATATAYLGNYPNKQTLTTVLQKLESTDAPTRRAALQALEAFPVQVKTKSIYKKLQDPAKIVRMEAARQLSAFELGNVDARTKQVIFKAYNEYENILLFAADRPEYLLSLAVFYSNRQMPVKAEKAYRQAIKLQAQFVPAYINYSHFLSSQNKKEKAFEVLSNGLKRVSNSADLHHALGLWLIRDKQHLKAIPELKLAAQLDKNNVRLVYVYAVAIGENNPQQAIKILEEAYSKQTGNTDIVDALSYYYKKLNLKDKSTFYSDLSKKLKKFSIQ